MTKKAHPEMVIPQLLEAAVKTGKERQALFSEYIRLHWRTTGKLAPGVNASDFYAALDARAAEQADEAVTEHSLVCECFISVPAANYPDLCAHCGLPIPTNS